MRAPWPLVLAVTLSLTIAAGATARPSEPELVVRRGPADVIARFAVREGAAVALRYRNSLYRSIAEERFRVAGGDLRLVTLAADERAVLDEYYTTAAVTRAPADDARAWRGMPGEPLSLSTLAVAATDLGERTLLVEGHAPLELWPFVPDHAPTIVIELRPGS